ncbi:N-glycosylase/DNA lyase [Candidatus Omnitrophota bacterium]
MSIKKLILEYKKLKPNIRSRLKEFDNFKEANDDDIFSELAFCIFTPGSKAINGDKAVKELRRANLLFNGTKDKISGKLRGVVRFHNNKASYLVEARKAFKNGKGICIKKRLNSRNTLRTRDWLVENIKGLGYKEAGHFLRNIGLGQDIAILDTHILKNLKRYRVISKTPESISKKSYFDIEEKMRRFSKRVKIPLDELDLLFWSKQTGFIFK